MSGAGAGAGTGGGSTATKVPSSLDDYEPMGIIGRGSFGRVQKVKRRADGRILVWKELNYGSMHDREKQLIVSEVNILRELRHPFIVRYYDRMIEKQKTKIYIVMEYCEGGDLGALIRKRKKEGAAIEEEFIWRVFSQIVCALKECHRHREPGGARKPILHRDIKPGNVFLDAANNVKMGDFGLAKELPSQSKFAHTNVGTPFYMSPEMINELRYNEKSDIWAVGCLLYELAALKPPFDATNHLSLAVKINAGKFARVPAGYSDDLHRVIRWMLQTEQSKRPSVEDLERLPRVRHYSREAALIEREYQLNHTYALRARELKAKDEDLRRREAALSARERVVRAREAAVASSAATGTTNAMSDSPAFPATSGVPPVVATAPPPLPLAMKLDFSMPSFSGAGGGIVAQPVPITGFAPCAGVTSVGSVGMAVPTASTGVTVATAAPATSAGFGAGDENMFPARGPAVGSGGHKRQRKQSMEAVGLSYAPAPNVSNPKPKPSNKRSGGGVAKADKPLRMAPRPMPRTGSITGL